MRYCLNDRFSDVVSARYEWRRKDHNQRIDIVIGADNFNRFPSNEAMQEAGFPEDYWKTIGPVIQEWSEFTCDLAERNDTPCVSLHEALNGPQAKKSPFQAGLLLPDGVHLSDKGHKAIAAELAELGFAPLA